MNATASLMGTNPDKKYGVFSKRTWERTGQIKVQRRFKTRSEARAWRTPNVEKIVHLPTGTVVR